MRSLEQLMESNQLPTRMLGENELAGILDQGRGEKS